ncbi:MAG: hypothetical protein IID37_15050 [Planctomycetes bacterium]|nr:hypothetical protein [Planctomycetota bacterium]
MKQIWNTCIVIGHAGRTNKWRRTSSLAVLLAGLGAGIPEALAQPKAQMELHASVEAVAPGQEFQIAVRFRVAKDWHLYWANPGDVGLPPRVRWTAPPGFELSGLRFPAPKRHLGPASIRSNILEGDPILLVDVRAPSDLPTDQPLTFSAKADWLVCKSTCLRERQDAVLTLPTVASADSVRTAHADLFRRARAAMPRTQAAHLTIQAMSTNPTIKPGESFEIVLQLSIKSGMRIQSHTPTIPGLVGTDVFVERTPGLVIDAAIYPPPEERIDKNLGLVAEYGGRCLLRLPVTADTDLAPGPVRVGGVLKYQACDKKTGKCFRPESVEWSVELRVDKDADS